MVMNQFLILCNHFFICTKGVKRAFTPSVTKTVCDKNETAQYLRNGVVTLGQFTLML